MSKKTQATKQATQQARKIRKAVTDNLVELDDKPPARPNPGELNQKIGQIDADLDGLRKDLNKTNKGLMNNLAQLNEKDTDLRSKVTEAYQQLGDLDAAYRSLTGKSSDISREIKAVAKRINEVNQKSDENFGSLSEEYRSLVERVEGLATKSRKTTQDLNKSIKANAKAMQELERNLLTEIDDLASASKSRDESLDRKTQALAEGLDKADAEIQAGQARLLKMQAIDQALERRAETLENSTSELTKKSRELSRSTTTLNNRTRQLSEAIAELQATSEVQGMQISGLQARAEKTANALYSMIMLEKRHFRLLSASLLVLLALFVGYLVYNQASWQNESGTNAALQSGIEILSEDLVVTDNKVSRIDHSLTELKQESETADATARQEIDVINRKLVTLGDQVDSLDGRVTSQRPNRSFGNGNVIHGPEWIASQPAASYTIHLATVSDKQALYDLAQRYSHYLDAEMAYLPVQFQGSERFALLHGIFDTESEAVSAVAQLPRYIERHRPSVTPMSRVQDENNKP